MNNLKVYELKPIFFEEWFGYAGVLGDLVMMSEDQAIEGGPLVRLHSACRYGDSLESADCDCGPQRQAALAAMAAEGSGIFFYLEQEGRGAGLLTKALGYALAQEEGLDTAEAYARMEVPFDTRQYGHCARFLLNHGIHNVRLLSNSPWKISALTDYGIATTPVPHVVGVNATNVNYLRTKRDKAGHLFPANLAVEEPR